MTPACVLRREHEDAVRPKKITDSPARKKHPHFWRAGVQEVKSTRPVRDWIRHGPTT